MTIQYIPLGIPVSTSVAINSTYTANVTYGSVTASAAEYTLSPVGPTGSHYKVASGSKVIVGNT